MESISRFARNTRDLLGLVKKLTVKGAEFISLKEHIDTTTPTGRFTLTVFAAIAELGETPSNGCKTSDSKYTVAISAFFYAMQHSFIPLLPDFLFMFYRFTSFLPLAVIMCVGYKKTKNPLPFLVGHFVLKIASVLQIIMSTVSPGFLYEYVTTSPSPTAVQIV